MIEVGEGLTLQLEGVAVDVVVGKLAAQLQPVVAVELPVQVGLADQPVFPVHH